MVFLSTGRPLADFSNHPQLDGKMWMIFPTDLKCRVYVSLSNPLWLIISNTVRHTNYGRTSKIHGIPVHEISCPYTVQQDLALLVPGTRYQVPSVVDEVLH